jgi:hypothetical protein
MGVVVEEVMTFTMVVVLGAGVLRKGEWMN